jgi:hypothetical protein
MTISGLGIMCQEKSGNPVPLTSKVLKHFENLKSKQIASAWHRSFPASDTLAG